MPDLEKPIKEEVVDTEAAFDKAMDKVETENKIESKVEAPVGDDIETPEGDEIPVEDETPEETPEGDEVPADDAGLLENIDPEVLEYCRDYYGDDAKILEQAKLTPDLFDDIRAVLDEEAEPVAAEKPEIKEPVVDELDAKLAKLDPDIHGQEITDILKSMAERQKQGAKVLTEEQGKLQNTRNEAFNVKIDTIFDGHTKSFPELGSSSKLTRSSKGLRNDVFAVAMALGQRRNKSPETMIGQAVKMFKNQEGNKKVAKQEVLDDLSKQEKTVTNPPTRRRSGKAPTYSDDYDKAEAVMEAAEEKAGLTT